MVSNILNLIIPNIPKDLQIINQWVCWVGIWDEKKGKYDKVPYSPLSGYKAKANDLTTWASFDDTLKVYQMSGGKYSGIGIELLENNGICGVDLDDCINEQGIISPEAWVIIRLFNSYTELSPSGKGIRIFVKAKLPLSGRRKGKIEVYNNGRFLTVTGHHIEETPLSIESRQDEMDQFHKKYIAKPIVTKQQPLSPEPLKAVKADVEILDMARKSKNGNVFSQLYDQGDWQAAGFPSQSEADLALANMLSFWFARDTAKVEGLFRQSGLYREKCDKPHYSGGATYLEWTVQKAVNDTNEIYQSKRKGECKIVDFISNQKIGLEQGQEDPKGKLLALLKNVGYFVDESGNLCYWKETKDGPVSVRLANFLARPVKEILKDNGISAELFFEIEGILAGGRDLPKITVSADKFPSMNWVTGKWGLEANIAAGAMNKDKVRHAIQALAAGAIRETIYTHTGWRKINDYWVYLHTGGAVGAKDIAVEMEGNLTRYGLPDQVDDLGKVIKRSLSLLEIANPEITYPLLAYTYLAPLCEPLRQAGYEPSFVLWLHGLSGVMKSTISALFMSHFGRFESKSPPGSFKDTATSIEKAAFSLKDSILWVDDFHPTDNKQEGQKMSGIAQLIMRMYGDRVGRGRCNADTSLKQSYPPRGLCICTGEDVVSGQSTNSRYLAVEIVPGDLDKSKLTLAQTNIDELSQAMHGYITWLAGKFDKLSGQLKSAFVTYRERAQKEDQHGRLSEAVAWLQIGITLAMLYAQESGTLDKDKAEEYLGQAWDVFLQLAKNQNSMIKTERPAARFISVIKELLATGTVYVESVDKPVSQAQELDGKRLGHIGWRDSIWFYLLPETAYKEATEFLSSQGSRLPVSEATLWKHLDNEGLIETENDGSGVRRKIQKTIRRKKYRVLKIKASILSPEE